MGSLGGSVPVFNLNYTHQKRSFVFVPPGTVAVQWLGHHQAHIKVLHAEIFKPADVFLKDAASAAPCL